MKSAADAFIQYTNRRKSHIEEAKEIEQNVKPIPLREVVFTQRLMVPTFTKELPKVRMTNISYAKPITDFAKVKAKLGGGKNNREVGIATFDYYMKNEVEE